MEKKEMNDATSSRLLQPPVYPRSPTTTNVPRVGNSHQQDYLLRRQFQQRPAAAAHFSSQAGPGRDSFQRPPSPLSGTTHASVGGTSNIISQDTVPGSGCAAGSLSHSHQAPPSMLPQTYSWGGASGGSVNGGSSAGVASQVSLPGSSSYHYQMPPPSSLASMALDHVPMFGGGVDGSGSSTFLSSLNTSLTPLNSSVDLLLQASLSSSFPPPLSTERTAIVDFGSTQEEYVLPPLPPSLSGPPPLQLQLQLQAATVMDLEPVRPAPADAWSSWGRSQLGNNTIASGGSSSAWLPQPYSSSGNTGNGITLQAPWTPAPLTSSSTIPAPAANVGVKREAEDWSWHTSTKRGKNIITSGGSSSSKPAYSSANKDLMCFGSKTNQLTSLGLGTSGSSSQYMGDANAPFVVDFADGLFTQNDIDKIKADKILAGIVLEDPKNVRSMLRKEGTVESSYQRKRMYQTDLERKVEQLQQENKSLSAQVHSLQISSISLTSKKNEMVIKLHGLEQQTHLLNDLNETLKAEVRRLKLASSEIRGSNVSTSSYQEMNLQTRQQEQLEIHNDQLAIFLQEQEQADLQHFIMQ